MRFENLNNVLVIFDKHTSNENYFEHDTFIRGEVEFPIL